MKVGTRKNASKKPKTKSRSHKKKSGWYTLDTGLTEHSQSKTVKSTRFQVPKVSKQRLVENMRKSIWEKESYAPPFVLPSDTLDSEILLAITQGQSETSGSAASISLNKKVEKLSTKYREMLLQQIHNEAIRKRIEDEHGLRHSSVASDEAPITFRTNNGQDDFTEPAFSFYNTYPLFAVDVPPPSGRPVTEPSSNSIDGKAESEVNVVEKEATIRGILSALRVSTHQMRALVQVQGENLNEYHEETKRHLRTMQTIFSEVFLPINFQLHSENMKFCELKLRQKRLPANFERFEVK